MKEVFKFVFIGLLSNLLNFLVYLLFYSFMVKAHISAIFGYISGLLISFFGNKLFTFVIKKETSLNELVSFLIIYFLGGILMVSLIYLLSPLINYKIAWLIGAFITATFNFIGLKCLVFKYEK